MVEFAIKSTGQKQVINGWNTHDELVTITMHEKGKTLEKAGGFVMSNDLWMGPKVAALRDLADFDRRYASKLYGSTLNSDVREMATDMRQMAAAAAMSPAFGKAMKVFAEHRHSFEGTAIRTNMSFVAVAGSEAPKQQESADRDSSPTSVSGAVIGGLFNKMKQRKQERDQKEKKEDGSNEKEGRSEVLTSSVELLKANNSASAADVALPAGFRQR